MQRTDRLVVVKNARLLHRVWFAQSEPVTFMVRPAATSMAWFDLLWGLRLVGHQLVLPVGLKRAQEGGGPLLDTTLLLAHLPFHSVALLGCAPVVQSRADYIPGLQQFARQLFALAGRRIDGVVPVVDNQPVNHGIMNLPVRFFRDMVWPIDTYETAIIDCLTDTE